MSVLDVCCGTGTYAAAVPGPYLGLDLNERFVRFARRRYSNLPRKQFVVGDATAMPLPRQSFDTAIFIDALHHFPVEINRAIFHQLAAIVRAEILIVDVSPHVRNPAKRLALAIDRGDFIRPVAQQVAIVESELRIVRRSVFDQGLYTQTVYVCRAP
ncbi:MAG: putative methyltransferase like protein [Chloroflexi bacterium]|nr:putative methyltransferase like protein [Chloroflexota bacterium]